MSFCCVIPNMMWWSTGGIVYTLMHKGVEVPPGALNEIVFGAWAFVALLMFVNLCWMVYAVRRGWNESSNTYAALPKDAGAHLLRPPSPDGTGDFDEIQPNRAVVKPPNGAK
jgi:hypothetical protein